MTLNAYLIDDRGSSKHLEKGLRGMGYNVHRYPSTFDAMDSLLVGFRPHLIISDLNKHVRIKEPANGEMESLDGAAFARKARGLLGSGTYILLRSGLYGPQSDSAEDPITQKFFGLYLEGVIDGFAPKDNITNSDDMVLGIITDPHFLIAATRVGAIAASESVEDLVKLQAAASAKRGEQYLGI